MLFKCNFKPHPTSFPTRVTPEQPLMETLEARLQREHLRPGFSFRLTPPGPKALGGKSGRLPALHSAEDPKGGGYKFPTKCPQEPEVSRVDPSPRPVGLLQDSGLNDLESERALAGRAQGM